MAIKAKIQFLTGDQKGKVVNVDKLPLLIGRVEGCDIVLAGDPGVSRRHAELRLEDGRVIVTDLGSSGGTTVNQQKISGEQPLKPGDVIGVGKYQMRIALPAPKAGEAKPKPAEDQEGTAFVDMAKMMSGGGDQEGTAFVDMDKFVSEAPAVGQEGTGFVDMGKLVARKTPVERWRELPRKKKIILGSAGGLLVLVLIIAVASALQPAPKQKIREKDLIEVRIDGTRQVTIPRAKEVTTSAPDYVVAWLDQGVDSIAQLRGIEECEAELIVTTLEGDIHIWDVVVSGYEDPYKGLTPAERLERGKKALADGDEKAKLAEGNREKIWYAYKAYGDAYAYLVGAQFAPTELVEEAKKKKQALKKQLDDARSNFEGEYGRALQMEQYDAAIRALESLTRIFPDPDEAKHMRYMYLIRQVKEKKAQ